MDNSIDNQLKSLEKKVEEYQLKVNENLSLEEVSQISKDLESTLAEMTELINKIGSDEELGI
jgi:hypothetical protein